MENENGHRHCIPGMLPWQNLVLAATGSAGVGVLLWWVNHRSGWPLGHWIPGSAPAQDAIPCWLWLGALAFPIHLLTARFAAQWLTARRSEGQAPGLRNLVVTATLALLPQISLDTCARYRSWYRWTDPVWSVEGLVLDWLPGFWLANVLTLLLVAPALVDKYPYRRIPPTRGYLLWIGWNGGLWIAGLGSVPDGVLAWLMALMAVISVWAFSNGYPRASQRGFGQTPPLTSPEARRAIPGGRDPAAPSA